MSNSGTKIKKLLGIEAFDKARISRILVSTYKIYVIFIDSKLPTKPITNETIKRMQYFLPAMEFPFKEKPRMLPLMDLKDYNGSINNAMYFLIDMAGRYGQNNLRTKTFENFKQFMDTSKEELEEFVKLSDLNTPDTISDFTARTRSERNSELKPENFLAKLVDINIDTVQDHVTFIFSTTVTTPIYPKDFDYKQTNPDSNFNLVNNPNKKYELSIRILDFFKWLKGTKPEGEDVTEDDVRDVLEINNVQVFSTSPSFHWQGMNANLSQLDGSIYPTNIMPTVWADRHGTEDYFLDKHLYGLLRQIKFFSYPMTKMLNKRLKDRELI